MNPVFFATRTEFRKWLEDHHQTETEIIVGFYKVGSGRPSITWSESVDEALCFGWIDGVRKSIDEQSYQIRFTKRKSTSIWSAVNIKKIEMLKKHGLMREAGLASFEKRTDAKSKVYSYEGNEMALTPEFEKEFRATSEAWAYFESLAPSYRKASANWVMGAKQESTRLKRLRQLITESEAGTNQWKDNKYAKK